MDKIRRQTTITPASTTSAAPVARSWLVQSPSSDSDTQASSQPHPAEQEPSSSQTSNSSSSSTAASSNHRPKPTFTPLDTRRLCLPRFPLPWPPPKKSALRNRCEERNAECKRYGCQCTTTTPGNTSHKSMHAGDDERTHSPDGKSQLAPAPAVLKPSFQVHAKLEAAPFSGGSTAAGSEASVTASSAFGPQRRLRWARGAKLMDAASFQTSPSLSPSRFNPTKAERNQKRREWSDEKNQLLQTSSREEEQEVRELEARIRLAEENKMKLPPGRVGGVMTKSISLAVSDPKMQQHIAAPMQAAVIAANNHTQMSRALLSLPSTAAAISSATNTSLSIGVGGGSSAGATLPPPPMIDARNRAAVVHKMQSTTRAPSSGQMQQIPNMIDLTLRQAATGGSAPAGTIRPQQPGAASNQLARPVQQNLSLNQPTPRLSLTVTQPPRASVAGVRPPLQSQMRSSNYLSSPAVPPVTSGRMSLPPSTPTAAGGARRPPLAASLSTRKRAHSPPSRPSPSPAAVPRAPSRSSVSSSSSSSVAHQDPPVRRERKKPKLPLTMVGAPPQQPQQQPQARPISAPQANAYPQMDPRFAVTDPRRISSEEVGNASLPSSSSMASSSQPLTSSSMAAPSFAASTLSRTVGQMPAPQQVNQLHQSRSAGFGAQPIRPSSVLSATMTPSANWNIDTPPPPPHPLPLPHQPQQPHPFVIPLFSPVRMPAADLRYFPSSLPAAVPRSPLPQAYLQYIEATPAANPPRGRPLYSCLDSVCKQRKIGQFVGTNWRAEIEQHFRVHHPNTWKGMQLQGNVNQPTASSLRP
jgi:hypothetical protein